jgi:glycosyltransferase involved in cell wall biosynthesis
MKPVYANFFGLNKSQNANGETIELTLNICHKYMEQKNHTFLLDIFAEIHKIQPEAKLLLVGGGYDSFVAAVNSKIEKLGLEDCVVQLGLRSDVPDLMQAMDVFVLPSLYEGLPVVGVEAQASGLPLLLSDTITREVGLLPSTEYLSLKQSPAEWAQKAVRLFEACKETRHQASEMVYSQGYDSKLVAERITRLYEEKLGR